MELDDLKDEIVAELAQLSDMNVSEGVSSKEWHKTGQRTGIAANAGNYVETTVWTLSEDPKKNTVSTWIPKMASTQDVGKVILVGTKLYFKPALSSEKIYLSDLIEPDSFDVAIEKMKHALNVAKAAKTPFGMPPRPPRHNY